MTHPRYTSDRMAEVLSAANRLRIWTDIHRNVAVARRDAGELDPAVVEAIVAAGPPDPDRVAALEAESGHEVVAFNRALTEHLPRAARPTIHHGLTSSDVVDTGWAVVIRDASRLVDDAAKSLCCTLADRSLEHFDDVCAGRTHGMAAEPTTFGFRLAGHLHAVNRTRRHLLDAACGAAVGTLSGPVGTHPTISPTVEAAALAGIGVGVEEIATQVVARDRHATLVSALAVLASTVDRLAVEIRMLHTSGIGEVREGGTAHRVGSSSMPHKRNPIGTERIGGLARVVRSNTAVALDDVGLWHERDLTNSSAERIVLPQALALTETICLTARDVIAALVVDTDRMRANVLAHLPDLSAGAAQRALTATGHDADTAQAIVSDAANLARTDGLTLNDALARLGHSGGIGPMVPDLGWARERVTALAEELAGQ